MKQCVYGCTWKESEFPYFKIRDGQEKYGNIRKTVDKEKASVF